jgi:hypothetical protein
MRHTCVLTTNGDLKCWGQNWTGQVSDGTTTNRNNPLSIVYPVTGRVVDSNNNPVSGVTISVGGIASDTTELMGSYAIGVPPGTNTKTATKSDYTASPTSREVNVPVDATGQNFTLLSSLPITGLVVSNDSPTEVGQLTTLTATIMSEGSANYAWSLGDGTISNGPIVNHTYPDVGIYTATITASNSISVVTATSIITVVDQPDSGLVVSNDSPISLGQTATLTAAISAGSNVT